MLYLEMSRDEIHGGGSWAFPNCVWVPTHNTAGGAWPFWSKILQVKKGDTILHLRGIPPAASFVGYSTASTDGYTTQQRPPQPGGWSFANTFYRADLEAYSSFERPINLSDIFARRRLQLEDYFETNREKGSRKLNIFFVRQSGRLQCLNGAYLSDVDDELFSALFAGEIPAPVSEQKTQPTSVLTGQQLATVRARIGQSVFSRELKGLYGHACCFPSCTVTDSRFLVASHIARWSDNETLRGHFGNGLCLCLMHDRAFEVGLFTLDSDFRVFTDPSIFDKNSSLAMDLKAAHGKSIRLSDISPLKEALAEHWHRVKLFPPAREEL